MNLHIVINKVYLKFFRPLTPVVGYFKYANYNVPLKKKYFDFLFSKRIPSLKDSPLYENAICNALREHVVSGDKIIIIGAGYGVTAALAANFVGTPSQVGLSLLGGGSLDERWRIERRGLREQGRAHGHLGRCGD
jgi:hypothetical protein